MFAHDDAVLGLLGLYASPPAPAAPAEPVLHGIAVPRVTPRSPESGYVMNCEHGKCSFQTNTMEGMAAHQRAHAMGIYACDLCDYESKLYANLKRHIRTHTKEKPFICTLCDRKVSSKISLDVHMKRIHTKEKPYKCEGCDASFSEAVELNRHLRAMHPDLKPRVSKKRERFE